MSNKNKKLFIGIPIAFSIKDKKEISLIKSTMKIDNMNWVNPANYHITLKFLGNTNENAISSIAEKLNLCTDNFNKFTIKINCLSAFYKNKSPKILYLSIVQDARLNELANMIEVNLAEYKFKSNYSTYLPHITLARFKYQVKSNVLESLISNYKNCIFEKVEVNEFCLYESINTNIGITYSVINRFTL